MSSHLVYSKSLLYAQGQLRSGHLILVLGEDWYQCLTIKSIQSLYCVLKGNIYLGLRLGKPDFVACCIANNNGTDQDVQSDSTFISRPPESLSPHRDAF